VKTILLRALMALCLLAVAAAGHAQGKRSDHPFERALAAGQYKEADRIAQRDLEGVAGMPDFRSTDTVERHLRAAQSATLWARWNEARQRLATLEKGMQAALPLSSPLWIRLHARQLRLHQHMSHYGAADAAYQEGRRKAMRHKLEAKPEFEVLLSLQQDSLMEQRREWDAITVAEERLDWLKRHDPANAVEMGNTLTVIGALQWELDRPQASAAAFKQALQLLEPAYASGQPDRHAATEAMKLWSDTAYRVRDYQKWDTCKLRKELLDGLEEEFGAASPKLVMPLVDMASYCEDEMRTSDVLAMFDRALTVVQAAWGPAHPDTLHVLEHQGTYHASRENSDAMVKKGRRILASHAALSKQAYADAPAVLAQAQILKDSDSLESNCGRFDAGDCKPRLERNLATLSRLWGDDHPAMSVLRAHVATRLGGFSYSGVGPADRAEREAFVETLCDTAFNTAMSRMGQDHPQTGRVAKACADQASQISKHERAVRFLTHAERIYLKSFGENDSATQEVAKALAWSRSLLAKQP
jgi:hypothetical protein